MTAVDAAELCWEADGLTIAGLAWGDPQNPPLLALHGWLDNAASFARLGPLLDGHYLIAVDLTGHGRSGWRSTDATYNIYDDLPQLLSVLDQLGWARCGLLGHSRGAIMAALLAACFPERVAQLVLLDGVAPEPVAEAEFIAQMHRFVVDRRRYAGRDQAVYPSVEEAVAMRERHGLPPPAARAITPRNLRPCAGGFTWSTDPRLRGASAMKLTIGQVDAMLSGLPMPVLLLAAEQGLAASRPQEFACLSRCAPAARVERLPGGHHFHLEEGVATLAQRIEQFLHTPV